MSRHYQIREFAKLAGVTVKALHHYDRLGLLKPRRTDAGYRVYCESELETLEQIIALKFLGLPLREIAAVLRRPALGWRETLRMQRQALENRQELLGRAIRVIRSAEDAIESGSAADPAILKRIIEVIEMQDSVAEMKRYYSEESWEQHRRYYEGGPSREWQALYSEGRALLGQDPASEKAQKLVARWRELSQRAHTGDPDVQTDSAAAWMDRANWPDWMKQRAAQFQVEEVRAFIRRAELEARRGMVSERAWAKLVELRDQPREEHTAQWRERAELFKDLEAAVGEDPAGPIAQALVARWMRHLERNSGGDPEVKAALLLGWSHRRNWPASERWRVEDLHLMSFDRFEKAADFLDRAVAAAERPETKVTTTETPKATLKTRLLEEFDEEMRATRKMLERVPDDKFSWKPHEKSSSLGKLANHVAAAPGIAAIILKRVGTKPLEAATNADLLASFDRNVAACREQFEAMSEARLEGNMLVTPTIEKPVWSVLRGRGLMNHLIHHRGQLSVYLRLLDVTVPGMYGPSAEEK